MLSISQEPSLRHRRDLPHWHVLGLDASDQYKGTLVGDSLLDAMIVGLE
jgi:hypothetical protein